jgi:hypothetical protein
MEALDQKNIKNTLVYTHLLNFKNDEFTSKVAKTADEASKLVEAGFEYVCTPPQEFHAVQDAKMGGFILWCGGLLSNSNPIT